MNNFQLETWKQFGLNAPNMFNVDITKLRVRLVETGEPTKGQLILKSPFGVFKSHKKKIQDFCPKVGQSLI